MKIAVSYLKSKFNLNETIKKINNTDAEYIHVDVMDGEFVDNKTYEFEELESILKNTNKALDVHLMVSKPKEYILKYKEIKPDIITIHSEIDDDIPMLLDLIHGFGIKAGISLNPKTDIKVIEKYLDKVDNVLIMSVEPGKGGQEFISSVIKKIKILNQTRNLFNMNYLISIDGGINDTNIHKTKGVDFVISGSFICMDDDYQKQIDTLKEYYFYNLETELLGKIVSFTGGVVLAIIFIYYFYSSMNKPCEGFNCFEGLKYFPFLVIFCFVMIIYLILLIVYIIKYNLIKKDKQVYLKIK